MTRSVLLDNTVLTNFAYIDRTDLIFRLWPESACTTFAVIAEYHAGEAKGKLPAKVWNELHLVQLTEQEADWANMLPPRFGTGERSCLAVALHRQGLFASDDLDARTAAKQHGIPITGTLGILLLSIQQGYLTIAEGNDYLRKLIRAGFHSPVDSFESLVKS